MQIIVGLSLPIGSVTREVKTSTGMEWSAIPASKEVIPFAYGHTGYEFISPAMHQESTAQELAALLAAIHPLGAVVTSPCQLRLRTVASW